MTTLSPAKTKKTLFLHDVVLIGIMGVLATCGLIYEYLLSHYAARILGAVESTIYAMIGIMIVSMGIGAYSARWFKHAFTAFAWLEAIIALLGMSVILVIAGIIALVETLPQLLGQVFNLPPDFILDGDIFHVLKHTASFIPYIAGFVLGALIGMEIPLIARARQDIYGHYLTHNISTIYGADYIGAGIGAGIWVTCLLSMEITQAAIWTALFNIIAGWIFIWRYRQRIRYAQALIAVHVGLLGLLALFAQSGAGWMRDMSNVLYKDQVVFSTQTQYQHISITQRLIGARPIYDLYLNGRLQFSSQDEHIYHSMLTYPAMAASRRHDNVLIIGGGDGLALRDVLRWDPKHVTLIDLDPQLVHLFSQAKDTQDTLLQRMTTLNAYAFQDPRVTLIFGDAFVEIDPLLREGHLFDTIIVDLPDPSHPDLNKVYSDYFYARLRHLLQGDGALAIQSTSPYHATKAFQSIGKTVAAAGFQHVDQYRQNVPSFGEWGWTIATKRGQSALSRLKKLALLPISDGWITRDIIVGAFAFPEYFYRQIKQIKVNTLGSGQLYQYHFQSWEQDQGILIPTKH